MLIQFGFITGVLDADTSRHRFETLLYLNRPHILQRSVRLMQFVLYHWTTETDIRAELSTDVCFSTALDLALHSPC